MNQFVVVDQQDVALLQLEAVAETGGLLGAAGPSKHDFYLDKTVVGIPLLPA